MFRTAGPGEDRATLELLLPFCKELAVNFVGLLLSADTMDTFPQVRLPHVRAPGCPSTEVA